MTEVETTPSGDPERCGGSVPLRLPSPKAPFPSFFRDSAPTGAGRSFPFLSKITANAEGINAKLSEVTAEVVPFPL